MSIDYSLLPSPSFVLEESRLIKNLEIIQEIQDRSKVSVILALKGFAMWKTFHLVHQYLPGAAASSLNEARLINEEMKVKAHTYSPAYLPNEFDEILSYSSHLTFNSLSQLEFFRERIQNEGVSFGLRVNPEYSDVGTPLYNPSDPHSRLGILEETLPTHLPNEIEGLHFHTLCESSAEASEQTIRAFENKFGHLLPFLKWVNFGGGHLVTRKGYDVEHLIQVLIDFRSRYPHLEVILEPGSAIAWETGELVATVLDIVHHRGIQTAVTNVSFTAHMPDTLEMPYRPKILGATDSQPGKPSYRIGGISCLAGDFLEAYSFDQPLQIGDRLIFWDMMHYTMVKTTTFNGVKHPAICILHTDKNLEIIREFGYQDFKNRLS